MKLSRKLLVASSLLLCAQARSQTLVCSLAYFETGPSFRAHFANSSSFPGRRSQDENLAMLRDTRKTEIYSISVVDGKRTLLFSDEGAIARDAKAYIAGIWRECRTTPSPGVQSDEAIYEITLDGSNHYDCRCPAKPTARCFEPAGYRSGLKRSTLRNFGARPLIGISQLP